MAQRTLHIGHSAAELVNFTGKDREVTVDITNYRIIIHDGATAGGHSAAKLSEFLAHQGGVGSEHGDAIPATSGFMSGGDKSKLDTIETAAEVNPNAAEILSLLLTVDGSGSGLDADLLDGENSSAGEVVSTIMRRDGAGRSKISTPVASNDIARKDTVDAVQTNLDTHDALTGTAAHGLGTASLINTGAGNGQIGLNQQPFTDIASAATTAIGGVVSDHVRITGSVTITSFGTIANGLKRVVRFAAALTLTHNVTSLILLGGANIITAANDIAEFVSLGSGNWICTRYHRADGKALIPGAVIQVVNTQTGAVNTGSTIFPIDNTTPQNTEGDEYMTLAITPRNTSNKLKIEVTFMGSISGAGTWGVGLFQDSTANALAAALAQGATSGERLTVTFIHYMTAGTVSATTFKVRAGPGTGGTTTFNGATGTQIFNGLAASSITITEIAA